MGLTYAAHYYPSKPYVETPFFLSYGFGCVLQKTPFPIFCSQGPKMLFPKMLLYPIFGHHMTPPPKLPQITRSFPFTQSLDFFYPLFKAIFFFFFLSKRGWVLLKLKYLIYFIFYLIIFKFPLKLECSLVSQYCPSAIPGCDCPLN